ncbi:hypothetical protein [Streptomyces sp. W1SF4]|uniref:hypothetical protein n=1 Tax=Streptomyces sp. W1SF4 TaxID=2305220 RepID=UPI000F70625F|nr:hypothetical protein [Streptomyces sp. W1SF4]AZM87545.1 hypothetical protein D1J60_02715 [Streptomyces sp. W1SF4]
MTHRSREAEPDTAHRPPAGAAGRRDTGLRAGALGELLGMTLAAGGLCLAVLRPELLGAVVHTLATTAGRLG